jgi:hypothetical protein
MSHQWCVAVRGASLSLHGGIVTIQESGDLKEVASGFKVVGVQDLSWREHVSPAVNDVKRQLRIDSHCLSAKIAKCM